jgi:hypothetical protein
MVKSHTDTNHKKSKLDQFELRFEMNRSVREERKLTKQRTHNDISMH